MHANSMSQECQRFAYAIAANKSLKEVDLSNNKLGLMEILNVVDPDVTTGGEALAALLRKSNCYLESLNLAW